MKNCKYCNKELIKTKVFCDSVCYGSWQKGKTFTEQSKQKRNIPICKVCGGTHFGKGYCRKHYMKHHYVNPNKIGSNKGVYSKCNCCGVVFSGKAKHCSDKCFGIMQRKPYIIKKGYAKLLIKGHHRADSKGYVFQHIYVMETFINRILSVGEEVHHIDGDRLNNKIENLILCKSHKEHMQFHKKPISNLFP